MSSESMSPRDTDFAVQQHTLDWPTSGVHAQSDDMLSA